MKRLEIIRVDPNMAYVVRLDDQMRKVKQTDILPYRNCMAYVMEHQEDATIYKIGTFSKRKDARRKLYGRILAADDNDAVRIFNKIIPDDGCIYQLLTGDWKIIAQRNQDGLTTII